MPSSGYCGCDTSFARTLPCQICLYLDPVVYGPHEYVARKGHFCTSAHFISRGRIQLEHWVPESMSPKSSASTFDLTKRELNHDDLGSAGMDGYSSVIFTEILQKGHSIGTASLFWQCYYYFYYRALGFVELLTLRQTDFRKLRLYKEFPVSYGVLKSAVTRKRWRQLFQLLLMLSPQRLDQMCSNLIIASFQLDSPTVERSESPVNLGDDHVPLATADEITEKDDEFASSTTSRQQSNRTNAKLLRKIDRLAEAQQVLQQQIGVLTRHVLGSSPLGSPSSDPSVATASHWHKTSDFNSTGSHQDHSNTRPNYFLETSPRIMDGDRALANEDGLDGEVELVELHSTQLSAPPHTRLRNARRASGNRSANGHNSSPRASSASTDSSSTGNISRGTSWASNNTMRIARGSSGNSSNMPDVGGTKPASDNQSEQRPLSLSSPAAKGEDEARNDSKLDDIPSSTLV